MKKNILKDEVHPFHKFVRPKLEAVIATFIVIGLIFFSTYLIYIKSVDSLVEEIKIGLQSNVSAAATTINGDLHRLFTKNSKREDSLYLSQSTPLENIRKSAKDIRYIYTNILIDDKVYFILNPSPQNDNDNDGIPDVPPALMDEYKDPAPALLKALKEQKTVVSDIYTDEWGIFISSYAPFYSANGQFVGTLGMDLELNNFYERLQPIEIAFEKTVIIIIFIGLVIGLLIWYIRKYTQALLLNRTRNKERQRATQISLENTYKENIQIIKKVRENLLDLKTNNIKWFKDFNVWIMHVIQYQKSKIRLEEISLENFEINDLINGIKNNIEKENILLDVKSQEDISTRVSGIPLTLGVELISTLLFFINNSTRQNTLTMMIRQLDEGVDDITIKLKLSGVNHEKSEKEFLRRIYPDNNFFDRSFEYKEFIIVTAINLLDQYQCMVTSFSNLENYGFCIDMKLYKYSDI